MRVFMAAVAALLLLAPGHAATQGSWYRIGGNAKTQSYVDLSSERGVGGKIIVVTKSVYKEPLDGGVYSTEIRSEYDCPGNYFRTLEYSYFDISGKNIGTEASNTINDHKVPAAGSINESMLAFICYRKGGTLVSDPYADAQAQFPLSQ